MQHKWNMYVNRGDRKIPSLIDQGELDLPCSNPEADSFMQLFDPTHLWSFLEENIDMSELGLYLSLCSADRPTFDGKQWFLNTACNPNDGRMQQEIMREVSWVNVQDLELWNASFRTYARIYQARGIVDYSLYASRCFGYCFLLGLRYADDDDDSKEDFTNFYPSIHHYNQEVAVKENELWQPFNDTEDWYPKSYVQNTSITEAMPALAQAAERVSSTVRNWGSQIESLDLDDILVGDSDGDEND